MREEPARAGGRPWRWMVTLLAAIFLVIIVLAMLSEREDAVRLPPQDLERRQEEPWAPEPLDSPAVPPPATQPPG